MLVRVYTVSEKDRREAQRVVDYATAPENVWPAIRPGTVLEDSEIPGNRPEFVAHLRHIGLRCVFTISDFRIAGVEVEPRLYRHLTVSSLRDHKTLPDRIAVEMVLPMFGIMESMDSYMGAAEYGSFQGMAAVVFAEPFTPPSAAPPSPSS